MPERSKQQTRRFPAASISQAFLTRRMRVSACLAEVIQCIQSLRAIGVMLDHNACAFGAAASAFRKSAGVLGSGCSWAGAISSVTTSPGSAPAASRIFRVTLSQWLPCPSGSSVARRGTSLMVPSTGVMPREGSFALAFFGRVRNVHATFAVDAGRRSVVLKRITLSRSTPMWRRPPKRASKRHSV